MSGAFRSGGTPAYYYYTYNGSLIQERPAEPADCWSAEENEEEEENENY